MILPQIPEIHIPTLTHKEPIVLLTKSMEALLAKSAKLQSVASTLNGEEDERQDFFGPTSSPNCMLGIIKSVNLKSVLTESTILPSLASTLKSVYEQMDDHYDTLAKTLARLK